MVEAMARSDRSTADVHAEAARRAIKAGKSGGDAVSLATAEALLAIFHQLRHMEDSITLRGAADLADSMDRLSRKLGDR